MANAPDTVLVGKKDVLLRLERVLARERQNNVLLVGEPGVGRTTLVEKLAKLVSWGEVAEPLRYKHIFELKAQELDPENLREFLAEATNAGNVIIVIDDIHAYPQLLDVLVPFTDVSSLQIIGITDFGGFHRSLKQRGGIMQRFEKVEVAESTQEETAALIGAMAKARGVELGAEVVTEIVELSNRLIHNSPQPEKSIDLLEELAVGRNKISTEDVHSLLSQKTGVPVGDVSKKERDVLLNLEEFLKKYIVGQEKAVEAISRSMRRARSGVSSEERPVGSFLFLGPTGVGKTYTAQTLARIYYGSFESVVHFDMTEYSRKESLTSFVNSLVVAIEENPFTLLLFDEIEKAHPEIFNVLLQVLDDGRLTDGKGRTVNFKNTIIIMTSNLGTEIIKEMTDFGFSIAEKGGKSSKMPDMESVEDKINEILRKNFRPEFLNRFDAVVLFQTLNYFL